jgi:diaminopropionate ammonia-lyase
LPQVFTVVTGASTRFVVNADRLNAPPPRPVTLAALGRRGRAEVEQYLSACPRHATTPLLALPGLARAFDLRTLHIKDEGQRLGLRSFKALGGAYAVMRLVLEHAARRLGHELAPQDLTAPEVRAVAASLTVTCATDGNHGRSVAAGARLAGCRAIIFMHGGVTPAREAAITAFGAEVVRVLGSYDDSVAEAGRQADARGWLLVSDTSAGADEAVPLRVMQGYTVAAGEAFDALPAAPTHIFVQAGVGGLAAAVAAHALDVYGSAMPRLIVVEPERAACLYASALAGKAVVIPHGPSTIMAMLECNEPSPLAWEVLHPLADAFVMLHEEEAVAAMRLLAAPAPGDPSVVAGESGCTGLAGLHACLSDPAARAALALGPDSRVLVFNSEGATDPDLYRQLTGLDASR